MNEQQHNEFLSRMPELAAFIDSDRHVGSTSYGDYQISTVEWPVPGSYETMIFPTHGDRPF